MRFYIVEALDRQTGAKALGATVAYTAAEAKERTVDAFVNIATAIAHPPESDKDWMEVAGHVVRKGMPLGYAFAMAGAAGENTLLRCLVSCGYDERMLLINRVHDRKAGQVVE